MASLTFPHPSMARRVEMDWPKIAAFSPPWAVAVMMVMATDRDPSGPFPFAFARAFATTEQPQQQTHVTHFKTEKANKSD